MNSEAENKEFLLMLKSWAAPYDVEEDIREDDFDNFSPLFKRLNEIAGVRRGEAQRLPSSVLHPI